MFWFVLPTLPMFLVLPALLRSGFGFWSALASSCALTVLLYFLAVWLLPKLGIAFDGIGRPLWVISGNGVTPASCPFFPLKADIRQREWHVRNVPIADIQFGHTRSSLARRISAFWASPSIQG